MASTVVPDMVAVRLQRSFEGTFSECGPMRSRPALYLQSLESVAEAATLVYNRWTLGERPNLLINLICGPNQDSKLTNPTIMESLDAGLEHLVENVDVSFVSSGLEADSLARVAGKTVRKLAEERDYVLKHWEFIRHHRSDIESKPDTSVMLLAVNSIRIVPDISEAENLSSVDQKEKANGWHTHFILLDKDEVTEEEMGLFRGQLFCSLAHQPAINKGQNNDDRYVSFPVKDMDIITPLTSSSEEPSSIAKMECAPLSLCIFASPHLSSLTELGQVIKCGTPTLIIEDASDLCQCLKLAWELYCKSGLNFDHSHFMYWLDTKLRNICAKVGHFSQENLTEAKKIIVSILAKSVEGSKGLLNFCKSDNLESISHCLIKTCLNCSDELPKIRPLMSLIVKLNLPDLANTLNISPYVNSRWCLDLFELALRYPGREGMVRYFLDSGLTLSNFITVETYLRLLKTSQHQDFLQTVILGHLLGYPSFPHDCRRLITVELNGLLEDLSLVKNVLPPAALLGASASEDWLKTDALSHAALAFWALIMNRNQLAKLLWAYTQDPIPLALVMSQMCKSLAEESHDWYFYEKDLRKSSKEFAELAVNLLSESHDDAPHRSYDVLCYGLDNYGGLTATHLAYQSGNKAFIAHECCQRWVNRMLYGQVQITNLRFGWCQLPSWLKVLLSGLFVVPINFWFRARRHDSVEIMEEISPNRFPHNYSGLIRPTQSNCSMISVRSLRHETLVMRNEPAMAEEHTVPVSVENGNGTFSTSAVYGGHDETDVNIPLTAMSPERTTSPEDIMRQESSQQKTSFYELLCMFYTAPVTKYWLSLVFRLIHLIIFGFALSQPACGSATLDLIVWSWSFIAWTESIWVLHLKRQKLRLRLLGWQLFDTIIVGIFLLLMLTFKIIANQPEIQFGEAFVGRAVAAFFMLYLCYATLFVYIPMSETLGPLMVRVKLMVTRDLVNYLVLVLVVMASCAIVVHAVIYPDYPSDSQLWHNAFHWAWFSLFTTDISMLSEPKECGPLVATAVEQNQYCSATSGYLKPNCPRPSWVGYATVIQYLVILKLISWPLLFALFGKTAKEVDDEADHIWKYQFYGLVTEFSLRPPLPPPLTPLVFLFLCCCTACGQLKQKLYESVHHPDMVDSIQMGTIIRSSSHRDPHYYSYWRSMALRLWNSMNKKNERQMSPNATPERSIDVTLQEIIDFGMSKGGDQSRQTSVSLISYPFSNIDSLNITEEMTDWDVLFPTYYPPTWNRPSTRYPPDLQPYVDKPEDIEQLSITWQKASTLPTDSITWSRMSWCPNLGHISTSLSGLPLNPSGRKGIGGRGAFVRFGPNHYVGLIVFSQNDLDIRLLTKSDNNGLFFIPHCFVPGNEGWNSSVVRNGLLYSIKNAGFESEIVNDYVRQLINQHGIPQIGTVINDCFGHVYRGQVKSRIETDNSWPEIDVFVLNLNKCVKSSLKIAADWPTLDDLKSQFDIGELEFVTRALAMF